MTHAQANALYRHQLNRKWGHTIARGWARLILDRLRDYVGAQGGGVHHRSTEAHTNDATHMNNLVSLTLHMQGKEETSRTNFPALSIGSLILYSL